MALPAVVTFMVRHFSQPLTYKTQIDHTFGIMAILRNDNMSVHQTHSD